MDIEVHEDIATKDAPAGVAMVERDDALKFAARTRQNLEYVEEVWQEHQTRGDASSVRLVTHILNSPLGLLVFSMERKFLKNVEDSSGIEWMRGRAASRSNPYRSTR